MMRIGFIGTGNFARQQAEVLRQLGASIVACYGTNQQKTIKFSQEFNCAIYNHPFELIHKDVIDALYIVIPPFAHDGCIEFRAIENNIPFLCEKPVGLNLTLCQSIAKAVDERGLITSSGYLLRQEPLFDSIKKIITRNQISTLRVCSYAYMPQVHWWRKMATSGGMMVESGSHYIDLLRYLIGEIHPVSAISTCIIANKNYPDCDIYDSMEALFTFGSGQIGSMGITHLLNTIDARNDRLEVYGDNFALQLDLYKLRYQGEAIALYKECKDNEWVELKRATSKTALLLNQSTAFLKAIETNNPQNIKSTYSDAVRSLRTALMINQLSGCH